MDFNKFDSRAAAETGQPMQILDQWTNEPMLTAEGEECCVLVRGSASKSAQAAMRAKQKAAIMSRKSKAQSAPKTVGDTPAEQEEEARVMEDVHNELCAAAAPFILGFVNVMNGERLATADDAEWFLNLSFPAMDVTKDEYGDPVVDADGVPKYKMTNNPFAKQVVEFAGNQANRLGNAPKS